MKKLKYVDPAYRGVRPDAPDECVRDATDTPSLTHTRRKGSRAPSHKTEAAVCRSDAACIND